jgi:hypothetical protein
MASMRLENRRQIFKAIRLHWENHDGDILVTPSDNDRFVIKVGQAIQILRQQERQSQFEKQFQLLVKRLAQWLSEHPDTGRPFLTAGEGVLRFVVMRNTVKCDDTITDALSDLEMDIANDGDLGLIKVNTTALPLVSEEGLQSFLDSDFCMEFYGDRAGPYIAGKSQP